MAPPLVRAREELGFRDLPKATCAEYVLRRRDGVGSQEPAGPGDVGDAALGERPAEPPTAAPPLPESSAFAQPQVPSPEPAARRRSRARRFFIAIVLVVILVLAAMGAGAAYANVSLSATYNPDRAVTDYFAAQKRGDADGMLANATFLRGDGSFTQYFDKTAVQQMLKTFENTEISDLKIVSSKSIDAATQLVSVSMTWHGKAYSQAYTVVKDTARVHVFFYYSWRIQIPFATIVVKPPIQGGALGLDGLPLPTVASPGGIQAIQGFHTVSMYANFLYDGLSQVVNAVDTSPTVTLPSTISASAIASAKAAIKAAFGNCDAVKYNACPGHTYYAPVKAGIVYLWTVPGYGDIEFTKYLYEISGDPSADAKLTVSPDPGKLTATGKCKTRLTIDDTKGYNLQGDYTATLTWSGGAFGADVTSDCGKEPAT